MGLLLASLVLLVLRGCDPAWITPSGFWPRVSFGLGVLAFGFVLLRCQPVPAGVSLKGKPMVGLVAAWVLLVATGVGLSWYHRPLARLRPVVPGRIYISAMPSYRGLSVEQSRLHFKTIINLFDEASTQASPLHSDELRFVREHNLRYVGAPADGLESDRFLEETLRLAQDPDSWPILIHCHGCMDRSPAWMGIYRFLVEGKSLSEVFAEIERHRGSRPKAIVTLQYNRKLPVWGTARFAQDETAKRFPELIGSTRDPFANPGWNPTATARRVITRIDPDPNRDWPSDVVR